MPAALFQKVSRILNVSEAHGQLILISQGQRQRPCFAALCCLFKHPLRSDKLSLSQI